MPPPGGTENGGSPISQGLLIELMQQMEARVDDGHGRVRVSLNELRLDLRDGFDKMGKRLEEVDRRGNRHSQRLNTIETERRLELQAASTRKQDLRDRNVLVTSLTSICVTVGIFAIKALLKL